jgi:hypothetical protein
MAKHRRNGEQALREEFRKSRKHILKRVDRLERIVLRLRDIDKTINRLIKTLGVKTK